MGTILVIISAVGFSFNGVWTTLIREYCELDVVMITAYRLMFMMIYCVIALAITKVGYKFSKAELKDTAIFGLFGNVLTLLLYSAATYHISVGLTCLLNYCYPLIVVVISRILYKEKIGKQKVLASILMVVGLMFTSGSGSLNFIGFVLGISSAISFAIYVLAQEKTNMVTVNGMKIGMVAGGLGFIILISYSLINHSFSCSLSSNAWLCIMLGSLTSNFLPIVCLSEGMKRGVSASKAGFLCILEPACSLIWDFLFFNTVLTSLSIVGVIIIFVSFFVTLIGNKPQTT